MSGRVGSLFPVHNLCQPAWIQAGVHVNAQNSAEARYYVDQQSRKWVGKPETETGFQPVLAEAICWFIGRESGVNCPMAGYHGAIRSDDFVWLSSYIPGSLHWEPRFGNFIVNDDEVGAMLALDAVTLNADRHRQNVLVVPEGSETSLRIWAIDSGNAAVGQIQDFCNAPLDAIPATTRFIRGLPISRLRVGAGAAATKMVALANHATFLGDYVDKACGLVDEVSEKPLLLARLRARMQNAHYLASKLLDALEAIQ